MKAQTESGKSRTGVVRIKVSARTIIQRFVYNSKYTFARCKMSRITHLAIAIIVKF